MYTCKSIGCRLSFKYREQLRRHYLKCEKPKVEKKLEFEMVDGESFSVYSVIKNISTKKDITGI